MDLPAQQSNNASIVPEISKSSPLLKVLLFVFVLIAGLIIGIWADRLLISSKQSQNSQEKLAENELPINLTLLTNPMIGEWRGAVEGTLVAKDASSITLKDDQGNRLKIPLIVPPATKLNTIFFDTLAAPPSSGQWTPVSIDQIALGSYLRGDFIVINGKSDMIVGSSFSKIKKPE